MEKADAAGYHTVAFSYGNPDGSSNQKNADAGSDTAFHPPFPVPENLLNNLVSISSLRFSSPIVFFSPLFYMAWIVVFLTLMLIQSGDMTIV